jgi:hypothetical protein
MESEYEKKMKEYMNIIESDPDFIALNFFLNIPGGWAAYLESIGAL